MNKIKTLMMAVVAFCAASITSCTDKMDWSVDPAYDRLFGILSCDVTPDATSMALEFKAPAGAEGYQIQWSTSRLPDDVEEAPGDTTVYFTKAVIENLMGDTEYYIRIRAVSDTKKCSKWYRPVKSDGSPYKTLKEQIMNTVSEEDRGQDEIRVTWDNTKEVTHLVVTGPNDYEAKHVLDAAAKAAGAYTVTGLQPLTTYTISIYNGEALRGTCSASTTAAAPKGDYTYNMPQTMDVIDNEIMKFIAAEAKAKAADPNNYSATIVIPAGVTIDMVGVSESGDKAALKIPEGMSVTFFGAAGVKPLVKLSKSINLAGSHAFVHFENMAFTDGGCQYIFNQSDACTVADLSFTGCEFKNLERSILRSQGSNAQSYGIVSLHDCVGTNLSSGNGYSMILIGQDKSTVDRLVLTNSTFDTVQRSVIEATKGRIGEIYVGDCTFYNTVYSGKYLIDANGMNTNITIDNTILGKTYDAESSRGIRTTGTITVGENNIRTSDCVYGSNDIKEFPASETLSSADIFTDPANHNFTLKIDQKVGDPRWYKVAE